MDGKLNRTIGHARPSCSAATGVPALEANTLLLFFLTPNAVSDDLLQRYQTWLSPAERQRLMRLCFARHQREYLLGRALVRYVVGAYTDRAPAEVVFHQNDFGKPYIDPQFALSFNLSHSAGVNVLAVARGGELGVDIEKFDASRADTAVARKYFAEEEYQQLLLLCPRRQVEAFFSVWTLKEAYIKAKGQGLSLPLSEFAFLLREKEMWLKLPPHLQRRDHYWHSELIRLGDEYLCAWAWGSARQTVATAYYWLVPHRCCAPAQGRVVAALTGVVN